MLPARAAVTSLVQTGPRDCPWDLAIADTRLVGRYHRRAMADQTTSKPLEQQLQEIGAQLAWVRDYL